MSERVDLTAMTDDELRQLSRAITHERQRRNEKRWGLQVGDRVVHLRRDRGQGRVIEGPDGFGRVRVMWDSWADGTKYYRNKPWWFRPSSVALVKTP